MEVDGGIKKPIWKDGFFLKRMAGVLGFEPRMPDSESGALPLGDTPKWKDDSESRDYFKFL